MEFKQYHDEEGNFIREMKFYFSHADKNKKISLKEILAFTSDTAVEDFHQRGITFDLLCDNNIAILVSRVSLHFHKNLCANDVIVLKTWEEAAKGLQLMRRYEISNSQGEKIISGNSAWICVNLANRRITRPTDFNMRPLPEKTTECCCLDCGKIHHDENMELVGQRKISFSDIDGNGHVNNSRYAEFVMDNLPEEFQNKDIKDFRINYAQEAKLGEEIFVYRSFDATSGTIIVVGKVGETVCFESELKY